MKLTFLGVSSALSDGFNSNMLLDTDNGRTMLIDCGIDVKHSLKAAGRKVEEIDAIYLSHLHSDHAGGMEWLGYYFYFILKKRPTLYIHESMVSDLWSMLRPCMEKQQGKDLLTLDEYFSVVSIPMDDSCFSFGGQEFYIHPEKHIESNMGTMYSYSLLCSTQYDTYRENKFYISTDANSVNIYEAKYVFHDCDVINLGGVHANYDDLKKIKDRRRKNTWLYHYTDLSKYDGKFGEMPDAVGDGFAGFVKEGQIFEF